LKEFKRKKHLYHSYLPPILIITLRKYHIYPEVINSVIIILNILTSDLDAESLINFFRKINLSEINSYLNPFKGIYFNNYSILFINYLNLLIKFAEIEFEAMPNLKEKSASLYGIITENIKSFYFVSFENIKILRNFKEQKKQNIEIHEIFLRLNALITRLSKGAVSLLKSNLLPDTLEYLILISESKNAFKNFEMLTGKNKENLRLLFSSIIENSFIIMINFFICYDEMKTKMVRMDIKDFIFGHVS